MDDTKQSVRLTKEQRRIIRAFARLARASRRRRVVLALDGDRRAGMTWHGLRAIRLGMTDCA